MICIYILKLIDESIIYNCTYGEDIYKLPVIFDSWQFRLVIDEIKQREFKKLPGMLLVDYDLINV